MPITVKEINNRVLTLYHLYSQQDHLALWRAVLKAIDEGAQDARLLARAALVAERLLPPPGSTDHGD